MAIEIIDTLSQKNNGSFPLVDSNDIRGGFYQVDTIEERDLIPLVRRKEGMLCAVKQNGMYQLLGGIDNECWITFNGGSSDIDKDYIEDSLNELLNVLNEKVDDVILTDDNLLNFYANNVLVKSIDFERFLQDSSNIGSEEVEELKDTKLDDIIVETLDGITYVKLFANNVLLKSIEIKTSGGDSLIHVGTNEPTADNCEVWIDVGDDEEFTGRIEDTVIEEVRTIISTLQDEINSLKKKLVEQEIKIVEHESRIEYLELHGGGSSGGSGGGNNEDTTTKFPALTFEDGTILTFEDGTILTFE